MRHQIRTCDAEGESRVVDVVDEVVHFRRREVHVAVDLELGGWARVAGEGRGGAAEYEAEVFVEVCEESDFRWEKGGWWLGSL